MSQERLPRVLQLVDRLRGPALYRTLGPCAELQRIGISAHWEFIGEDTGAQREELGLRVIPDDVVQKVLAYACSGRVDAVVLPRMGWHEGDESRMRDLVAKLKRARNTLIYEADDDILSPWIVQQQATGLHRGTDRALLEAERLSRIAVLRLCDGATVSTQRLATVVRQFVPETFPIHVVPNLIDWAWWQRIKAVAQRWIPPLTIGWAGGGRPDADLAPMAWAWGEVAKTLPDVRFVVAGCRTDEQGKPSLEATPWAKQITDFVPAERIEALPWFSITEYPLSYLNIDIGCCPLVDVPFSRCKTAIKLWEHTAAGAAVVASPTVYGPFMQGLPSNFICPTKEEWRDALLELARDPTLRSLCVQEMTDQIVPQHTLQEHSLEWVVAWQSIIEQARAKQTKKRLLVAVN